MSEIKKTHNFSERHILLPTKVYLKNVYYLYSACSNSTYIVLVIVLSMIIGKGAWYRDNHLHNISGIRTRAIEIVNVFEKDFGWAKDMRLLELELITVGLPLK